MIWNTTIAYQYSASVIDFFSSTPSSIFLVLVFSFLFLFYSLSSDSKCKYISQCIVSWFISYRRQILTNKQPDIVKRIKNKTHGTACCSKKVSALNVPSTDTAVTSRLRFDSRVVFCIYDLLLWSPSEPTHRPTVLASAHSLQTPLSHSQHLNKWPNKNLEP